MGATVSIIKPMPYFPTPILIRSQNYEDDLPKIDLFTQPDDTTNDWLEYTEFANSGFEIVPTPPIL